jgi:predicted Ser/Thr protein kinase
VALRSQSGASPPGSGRALSRAELGAAKSTLLSRGGRRNPDVLLVERAGERLVVKDFAPRGALVRALLGPRIAAREARAYQALDGHPAVPRFLGWIDPLAFAVEYRPGRRMSRRLAESLPDEFLPRLETALREMHARGVVHLDLRHRSNVLLADDGSPVLIDFGSALCFRPGGLAARALLPLLARVDLGALAKWRRKLGRGVQSGSGGASSGGGRSASRPT